MTDDGGGPRPRLEQLSTHELVSILRRHDADEWRPEVFGIVKAILAGRGVFSVDVGSTGESADDDGSGSSQFIPSDGLDPVASGLDVGEAEDAGKILRSAGMPVYIDHTDYGFSCYVPEEHVPRATELLQESDLLPAQENAEESISIAGGPCPGCGAQVPPGSGECAECGLAT